MWVKVLYAGHIVVFNKLHSTNSGPLDKEACNAVLIYGYQKQGQETAYITIT